jgi:uncharacterized membrane protein HdeD (DUF308 family)
LITPETIKVRIIAVILGSILGIYMLFNGIFELVTNRLFAETHIPRPWMAIVNELSINVVALGPIFIVWGIMWLYFAFLLWNKKRKAYWVGLAMSVLSLVYFPFGTVIGMATITLLRSNRKPSGLLR